MFSIRLYYLKKIFDMDKLSSSWSVPIHLVWWRLGPSEYLVGMPHLVSQRMTKNVIRCIGGLGESDEDGGTGLWVKVIDTELGHTCMYNRLCSQC